VKLKKIKKDMTYINTPKGWYEYCNGLTVTNIIADVKHTLLDKAVELNMDIDKAIFHIDYNVRDTNPDNDYTLKAY